MTKQELMEMIVSNAQDAVQQARWGDYEYAYKALSRGINTRVAFELAIEEETPGSERILAIAKDNYSVVIDGVLQRDYECAYHALESVLTDLYDVLDGDVYDADA